jgi:8-oxo-dGTP diphosphatase
MQNITFGVANLCHQNLALSAVNGARSARRRSAAAAAQPPPISARFATAFPGTRNQKIGTIMFDRKTFQETLPQKRISAGCLLFDEKGRLLVVNPTYKGAWEIPGGVVEKNESPREAVIREIYEELGLLCQPDRLLCVDFSDETDTRTESLHFIFLGPVCTAEIIAAIQLPREELSEYRFLKPKKAIKLLNKKLRRRVRHCLSVLDNEQTLYLEEQEPIFR